MFPAEPAPHVTGKVLHVVSGLMFGGGQKVALDLRDGLRTLGISADLCLLGCNQPRLEDIVDSVVTYSGRYNRPVDLLKAAGGLRGVITAGNYSIVHSHGWDADAVASLATRGRPVRHVVHLHVMESWLTSRSLVHIARRALTRMIFRRPDTRVVSVSQAVSETWSTVFGNCADLTRVVHNGVDTRLFSAAPKPGSGTIRIGVACRLVPQKGVHFLIEAVGLIKARQPAIPFALNIAGAGSERKNLEQLAESKGLGSCIAFVGALQDMPAFYRSLDVLVLPSTEEGLPLTVLEAMSCGVPVVATDVGGTREALRDGMDGFIVPPRSPEALAEAIMKLLQLEELRRDMGMNARQRITEAFSLQQQARSVASLYGR